jgi:hypothetical protein
LFQILVSFTIFEFFVVIAVPQLGSTTGNLCLETMLNLIHNTVIKVDREPSYERILGRRSLVRAHLWRLDFVGQNQASQLNRETIHWAFRQYEHLHLQLTTDGLINVIVDHWNTYCPVIRTF